MPLSSLKSSQRAAVRPQARWRPKYICRFKQLPTLKGRQTTIHLLNIPLGKIFGKRKPTRRHRIVIRCFVTQRTKRLSAHTSCLKDMVITGLSYHYATLTMCQEEHSDLLTQLTHLLGYHVSHGGIEHTGIFFLQWKDIRVA